jgi:UV excision repair protein RAD23
MSEAVANICAMGFEQSQVEVALEAAYGNPDRAVEYLFDPSSMPAQQPQMPANPAAAMPANPAPAMPANPAAAGGMPAGMPPMTPEMAQMMQSPQLQGMMQAIQQNPAMLQQVIQQIQQTNPELMQTIAQNQDAFMAMLAGGMGAAAGGDAGAAGGQGQPPPGAIMVTAEEKQALENLEALFPAIDRAVIFQTYKACGGDEQLTSNLLMDNAADFMMDDDAPAGGNQ